MTMEGRGYMIQLGGGDDRAWRGGGGGGGMIQLGGEGGNAPAWRGGGGGGGGGSLEGGGGAAWRGRKAASIDNGKTSFTSLSETHNLFNVP